LGVLKAAYRHFLAATDLQYASTQLLASLRKRFFIDEPEGTLMEIGQFATVRNGTTPRRNREDYWEGGVPWLPTGKVNERRIVAADQFITAKALAECSLSLIPRGASLVAMVGEGQTRGRTAFLELEACINQNFGAVIPDASVDPLFLFFLLESHYEGLRHWSQGTNQHALNCKLISSYRVKIPTLQRQRKIASVLSEADLAASSAATRVAEARSLFHSIVRQLLAAEAL
jgi:type I restriction enzyme S subunit